MRVLITAGPTYEKIDPVRFIGNYSSGKMGFAIAEECTKNGFEVVLVAGPVSLKTPKDEINRIDVESAEEMYNAVMSEFPNCDIAILCAAVADFTPIVKSLQKLKREKENLVIELKPTKDIAASVGTIKRDNQMLVGFALETNDEEANAIGKMKRKNLDFIVLNSLNDENACFGYDTNKIKIIESNGSTTEFPLKQKSEVAKDIVSTIISRL